MLKDGAGKPGKPVTPTASTAADVQRLVRVSHSFVAKNVTSWMTSGVSLFEVAYTESAWVWREASADPRAAFLLIQWWNERARKTEKSSSPIVVATGQLALIRVRPHLGNRRRVGENVHVFPSSLTLFCARCGSRYESKAPRYKQTCGCDPRITSSTYRPHASGRSGAWPLEHFPKVRWVWPAIPCAHPECETYFDADHYAQLYCDDHRHAAGRMSAMRTRQRTTGSRPEENRKSQHR